MLTCTSASSTVMMPIPISIPRILPSVRSIVVALLGVLTTSLAYCVVADDNRPGNGSHPLRDAAPGGGTNQRSCYVNQSKVTTGCSCAIIRAGAGSTPAYASYLL